jgi:hypothetical protein
VIQPKLPFNKYHLAMKQYLIARFGSGRWSLYVDQDELFDYPYSNIVGLSALLRYLNEKRYTTAVAQMLGHKQIARRYGRGTPRADSQRTRKVFVANTPAAQTHTGGARKSRRPHGRRFSVPPALQARGRYERRETL